MLPTLKSAGTTGERKKKAIYPGWSFPGAVTLTAGLLRLQAKEGNGPA